MAKHICPKCSQVTLTLGEEDDIRCPFCNEVSESDSKEKHCNISGNLVIGK